MQVGDQAEGPELEVRRLEDEDEARWCARTMAASEPWLTLGRTYQQSLTKVTDPTREIYVAAVGRELVGFAVLCMAGAFVGYVQTICVAPAWRRRGVGTRLLRFAEERILRETPNVFLCVSSFNERARELYERVGYEVVGELRDYIVRGHSEILMRKSVGPLSEFEKPPSAFASGIEHPASGHPASAPPPGATDLTF